MKKFLVAAVAAVGLSGSAFAADMPVKAPMAPAYVIYNWDGFYAGIEGGGGSMRSHIVVTGPGAADSGYFSNSSGLVGGTLGWNWKVPGGPWLLGLEGDLSWTGMKASGGACAPNCNINMNWLGTVRGRAGYVAGPWLLYATGGLAVARIHGYQTGNFDFTDTVPGWTFGGGVEAFVFPRWTVKAEYLYVSLNSSGGFPIGGAPANQVGTGRTTANIYRVGLNYHF
jgi:outer membrane immunogenic protein